MHFLLIWLTIYGVETTKEFTKFLGQFCLRTPRESRADLAIEDCLLGVPALGSQAELT